ncbi:MAG: winged helix-turn-helix domain-containing protein [Myxococcota bacterium]
MSIPLRFRIPNGPPLFVGRALDVQWLRQHLAAAPVQLLVGPGGVGKTALALHVLHQDGWAERAVFVAVRPGDTAEALRRKLLHVLSECSSRESELDLPTIAADPDLAVSTIIDLAEAGPWAVVVDDLHQCEGMEGFELLSQLAVYGRRARFVATSRLQPPPGVLVGDVRSLGTIEDGELARLGRWLVPQVSDDRLLVAVRSGAGSPWLLMQYLTHGRDTAAVQRAQPLEGLHPTSRALLQVLSVVRDPLAVETLVRAFGPSVSEHLEGVAVRGLVQFQEGGVRAHDLTVALVFEGGRPPAELTSQVAERLMAVDVAEAQLVAGRLWAEAGDLERLIEFLEHLGHGFLASGQAPRLWAMIATLSDPRLEVWKLRCATELGNATVLGAVASPGTLAPEDRYRWAVAQYLMGEPEASRDLGLHVAGENTKDAPLAALLVARIDIHRGRLRAALERLAPLEGPRAEALSYLAIALASEDLMPKPVETNPPPVEPHTHPEAALDVAEALHRYGRWQDCKTLVTEVLASPKGKRVTHVLSRRAMLLQTAVALDEGELDRAGSLIRLLRPYIRGPSLLRPFLLELDARRRILVGEFSGLGTVIEQARISASVVDVACAARVAVLERHFRRLTSPSTEAEAPASPNGSTRARVRGATVRHLQTQGAWSELAERLCVQCDAHLIGDRRDALERTAAELAEIAERIASPRFANEAALYEGFQAPAVLEQLAGEPHTSPVACRRARALLSGNGSDSKVVEKIRHAWGPREVATLLPTAAPDWCPGWGLDMEMKSAWLPDGGVVEFARTALLWRILLSMANHGGTVSKQRLIEEAWGEPPYHPHRHDPKIHVSIRKLRRVLKDEPTGPIRIVTVAEGYAMGAPFRVFRRRD